jgi:hypothetical protein
VANPANFLFATEMTPILPTLSEEVAYSYAVKMANLRAGPGGLSQGMFSPGEDWDKNPVRWCMKDNPSMEEVPVMPKKEMYEKVKDKGPAGKVDLPKEQQGVANPVTSQKDSDGVMQPMILHMRDEQGAQT